MSDQSRKMQISTLCRKTGNTDVLFEPTLKRMKDLKYFIQNYAWSHCLFKNGYRLKSNFLRCDFLVFDIDEDVSIEEAVVNCDLAQYIFAIGSTKSHQEIKNGEICDRFRLILPLSEPITDPDQYEATWNETALGLGIPADKQARDVARAWQPCSDKVFITSRPQARDKVESVSMRIIEEIRKEREEEARRQREEILKYGGNGVPAERILAHITHPKLLKLGSFQIACILTRGYALTPSQALPFFEEWNFKSGRRDERKYTQKRNLWKLESAQKYGTDPIAHLVAKYNKDKKEWLERKKVNSPKKSINNKRNKIANKFIQKLKGGEAA